MEVGLGQHALATSSEWSLFGAGSHQPGPGDGPGTSAQIPPRLGKGFCLHLQRLETACTSQMCSCDWRAPDPTLQAREQLGTHSAHDKSGPHVNPSDTHGEELSSPALIPTSDPLLMISSQGPSKSSDHLETVSGKQGLLSVSVKSLNSWLRACASGLGHCTSLS